MLKFLMPVFVAAGFAIAGESMCLDLCEPCKNSSSKDATCAKVFETCKCTELFQKAEAEAAAKSQRTKARREVLGNSLYENCAAGKCVARVWFEGSELKKFQANSSKNFAPAPAPAFEPYQNECAELCKIVAEDSKNKMAAQIENSCGCSVHVQDSLKLVDFRLARIQGANAAADSVVKACEADEICKVEVALAPETFAVARLVKLEAEKTDQNELNLLAFKAKRRAALGNSLYENCKLGRCWFRLNFEGEVGNLKSVKPEGAEAVPEPSVKALSAECTELCQAVPEDPESKMTAQIEGTCGCKVHEQDSVKLEKFRAARIANSNAAADSVVEFCAAQNTCNVKLALDGTTFKLEKIQTFEPKKEAPKPVNYDRFDDIFTTLFDECETADSSKNCDIRFIFEGSLLTFRTAQNPSKNVPYSSGTSAYVQEGNVTLAAKAVNDYCAAEMLCDVDVSLKGESFELISLSPHRGTFPFKEEPEAFGDAQNEQPAEPEEEKQYSYGGLMLYVGGGSWSYSKDYFDWVSSDGVDVGLGYLHRWYFYEWGSFQMGFNVNYSYIDLGSDEYYVNYWLGWVEYDLLYHKISAEIPLQLRIGVPYLYGTFLMNVRKQIWSVLIIDDGDDTEYSYSGLAADDWNFQGYLGFGFELSRHFLIDLMWNLFDLGTAGDYVEQDDLFRLQLNFAW